MSLTMLPSEVHIGTRNAFRQGREYKYLYDQRINGYICDHQTTTSVDGEVLAIMIQDDPNGTGWYVAVEGRFAENEPERFIGRQAVFRTQERFWETGNHEWQLNSESSSRNTLVTWDGSMTARTEVPQNAAEIAVSTQLTLTDA